MAAKPAPAPAPVVAPVVHTAAASSAPPSEHAAVAAPAQAPVVQAPMVPAANSRSTDTVAQLPLAASVVQPEVPIQPPHGHTIAPYSVDAAAPQYVGNAAHYAGNVGPYPIDPVAAGYAGAPPKVTAQGVEHQDVMYQQPMHAQQLSAASMEVDVSRDNRSSSSISMPTSDAPSRGGGSRSDGRGRGQRAGRGGGRGSHQSNRVQQPHNAPQPTAAMPIAGGGRGANRQPYTQQPHAPMSPQQVVFQQQQYYQTNGFPLQGSPGTYASPMQYAYAAPQTSMYGRGPPVAMTQQYMPQVGFYPNTPAAYTAQLPQAPSPVADLGQPAKPMDGGSVQRASAAVSPATAKVPPRKKEALLILPSDQDVKPAAAKEQAKPVEVAAPPAPVEAPAAQPGPVQPEAPPPAAQPEAQPAPEAKMPKKKVRSSHTLAIVEATAPKADAPPAAKGATQEAPATQSAPAATEAPPAATAADAPPVGGKPAEPAAESAPAAVVTAAPAQAVSVAAAAPAPANAAAAAAALAANAAPVPVVAAGGNAAAAKAPARGENGVAGGKPPPDSASIAAAAIAKAEDALKSMDRAVIAAKPPSDASAPPDATAAPAVPEQAPAAPAKPAAPPAAPQPDLPPPPPPAAQEPKAPPAAQQPAPPPAPAALAQAPSAALDELPEVPPSAAPGASVDPYGLSKPYAYPVEFLKDFSRSCPPGTVPITTPEFDKLFKQAQSNPRFSDTIFNLAAGMTNQRSVGRGGGGSSRRDDRDQRGASSRPQHLSGNLETQGSSNWERGSHAGGDRRPPGRDDRRGGGGGDQWERGRNFQAASQANVNLHKSEQSYKLKSFKTDDPAEEQKQREFKAILNKLTPDNFDRLIQKIEEVEVVSPKTLKGFVDQIFNKALTETIFCELYSKLCAALYQRLPRFEEPGPDNKVQKYNVRTVVIEKCQDEFEKGSLAAIAQKKREMEEAARSNTRNEETLSPDEDLARRRADLETIAKELAARRRALGNMQFIGFLYKQALLTETVLHMCIQQLLQEKDNPKPEDLECVSKLLVTTGANLEAGKQRSLIEVYFARIEEISRNKKLDSRIRFMLLDLLELRQSHWQARREPEGPKKIEDIHREAAQQEAQARRAAAQHRQDDRRRGPMDMGGRGSMVERPRYQEGPVQPRVLNLNAVNSMGQFGPRGRLGGGGRGIATAPQNAINRTPSAEVNLRPGGPRPAGVASASVNGVQAPPHPPARAPEVAPPTAPAAPTPPLEPAAATPDLEASKYQTAVKNALAEFSSHRSTAELMLALKDVADKAEAGAKARPSSVLCFLWLCLCNVHKDVEQFMAVARELTEAATADAGFAADVDMGPALHRLIAREAAPFFEENLKAKELLARLTASYVSAGVVTFGQVTTWVRETDPEDPEAEESQFVDSNEALDFVGKLMMCVKETDGEAKAKQMWVDAGVTLDQLCPSFMADKEKAAEAAKLGLSWLL